MVLKIYIDTKRAIKEPSLSVQQNQYLYCTGMFILISKTMETKYMPMICESKRTTKLELLGLEIQMKNLDMVKRRPRVEETTMAPTRMNEIC
jgi:hypothetical protein